MKSIAKAALAALCAVTLASCASGGTTTPPEQHPGGSAGDKQSGEQVQLACPGGELVGGGATSQKLAMESLTSEYRRLCQGKGAVEYTGTGSGQGIKDFSNGQIDWAGSDSPLKDTEKNGVVETEAAAKRCGAPAWDLPTVISPVAFAYNLPEVDKLILTPELIAQISYGKITKWDDPAIAKANPDAKLPAADIKVFFRSDESGTTENVTKFLKAAAPDSFTGETGKKWPGTAGEGKQGTQGVADGVAGVEGGFGFMEWKFATDSQLGVALLDNGAGAVELTPETVAEAINEAAIKGEGNDLRLEISYTGTSANAYPMVMPTYQIVCSKGQDAAKTALLKDFLGYLTSDSTQAGLVDLGYGPLPEELRGKVASAVSDIS